MLVTGDLVHQRKLYFKTPEGNAINNTLMEYSLALLRTLPPEQRDAVLDANGALL